MLHRLIDQDRDVGHQRFQALPHLGVFRQNLFQGEGLGPQEFFQVKILFGQDLRQLGLEAVGVDQVRHPDAPAGHLVFVTGADAPAGGADLAGALLLFPGDIDALMIRHDHLGAFADAEVVRPHGMAALFEPVDFHEQDLGVQDHAVADAGIGCRGAGCPKGPDER